MGEQSHTGNIYGKPGAHNRTEALVTARNLGLLKQDGSSCAAP